MLLQQRRRTSNAGTRGGRYAWRTLIGVGGLAALLGTVPCVEAAGLPGEFLLSSRWRELFGMHSALTNPAFLTEENYVALRGAYAPVLQGAFQLAEVGVTVPIGLYHSAGVSVLAEFDGDATQDMFDPATGRVVPGDATTSSNTNAFTILSYAVNPWNRLSLGGNLTWAYSTNFGEPVYGIGLDLGASYRLPRHPLLGDHFFGVSTVNLIAPSMSSSVFEFGNRGEYSRNLKFSWAAALWDRQVDAGIDFDLKDFLAAAEEFGSWDSSGWSLSDKTIEWDLSARLGGWILRFFSVNGQLMFNERGVDAWGLGAGINAPSLNQGRDFAFLYEYNLKTEGDLASTHTMYVRADVGKHREELYARRMARLADLSPNELYNRAMTLYAQGKYWDAFFVFSRIVVEFPDFFKNDWVVYYRGRCEEALDMRRAATANYEDVKKTYPKSDVIPHADLGIMRVCYRNDDFGCVATQYPLLAQIGVPDSLRFHAAYLMGETFLKQGEYYKAIQVFIQIPPKHPAYVFAQHSTAVARILAGVPRDQVLLALEACINAGVSTPQQREVVNRSYIFFGYLYYENGELPKAVTALRKVPPESYYYEDALLGLGWCAIKAQQWADCIDAGKRLSAVTTKGTTRLEAMLMQGFGSLQQKNYPSAFALLDNARTRSGSVTPPADDSLSQRRVLYDNTRIGYDQLADNMENISLKAPSPYMLQQIDSLHVGQIAGKDTIDAFLKYADEFVRQRLFARPLEEIKQDIEYAHATVQRYVAQFGDEKIKAQIQEEQRKLNEEIEKLKQEMKGIETQ